MLIWKIAWRNLLRHKGKSLVIGIILFLGALLMTVGNAIIEGAKQGLEEHMINRFTGNLILVSSKEKKENVFFNEKSLKVLSDYPQVKQILEKQDIVEGFLPMTRGVSMILNEEEDMINTFVFGVNFGDYQETFLHNVIETEGVLLKNGERGILISDKLRQDIYEDQQFWIVPEGFSLEEDSLSEDARKAYEEGNLTVKSQLVFMGLGSNSLETDIRLPVKGIVRFKSFNAVWEEVSFMDIESYRECFGYITAADNAVELSEQQVAALEMDDADDIFAEAEIVEDAEMNVSGYDLDAMQQQTQRADVEVNPDSGAYNLVAVKLKPGVSLEDGKRALSQVFADEQAEIKVLTWKQACMNEANFASLTQGALSVFVLFIFFVAIIVIMNTLSMAALERTSEIGMMRAVGARKSFISRMFFAETSLLSFVFGGLGIVCGIFIAWGLAIMKIPVTQNTMLTFMFGGDTLRPVVDAIGAVSGGIQLAIVTLLAMLYPILVARKITPLEAISRD